MKSVLMTAIVTAFILLTPRFCHAQRIVLLNSTEKHWSGGIAGRSGTNYTFSIRFDGFRPSPELDTIWIGDDPVPILINRDKPFNTTVTRTKKSVQFDISAGTSRDEYADRYTPYPGKKAEEKPKPPKEYSGVALISYTVAGKKLFFVVSKIMQHYPPVNYP